MSVLGKAVFHYTVRKTFQLCSLMSQSCSQELALSATNRRIIKKIEGEKKKRYILNVDSTKLYFFFDVLFNETTLFSLLIMIVRTMS